VAALTGAALVGFASNTLLTRGALSAGTIDPASFLAVRLASGAAALWLLSLTRSEPDAPTRDKADSWASALALAGYGVAFTFAYTRIGAGLGALVLFGAVQTTMISASLLTGERPAMRDAAGLVLALAGLGTLTLPGASAPSLVGVVLMAAAGVCWGIYSLRGRGSRNPLSATARNFLRATPIGVATMAIAWPRVYFAWSGVGLAVISGAITSGVGYAFWYAALPHLTKWRAAVVQLLTPVLTAAAAVVILNEPMTVRLWIAGGMIVAGVLMPLTTQRTSA
jgi:drug/metabolite transporter (DMT)-like permease